MAIGDKKAYSDKQKRMAQHIEDSEKGRGEDDKTAARIAWATVNKVYGGGKRGTKPERKAKKKKAALTKRSRGPLAKKATTPKKPATKKTDTKKSSAKKVTRVSVKEKRKPKSPSTVRESRSSPANAPGKREKLKKKSGAEKPPKKKARTVGPAP